MSPPPLPSLPPPADDNLLAPDIDLNETPTRPTEISSEEMPAPSGIRKWTRRNFVKILLGSGGTVVAGGGLLAWKKFGGNGELTEHDRIIKTMGYTRDDLAVMATHQLSPEQCAAAGVKGGKVQRAIEILNGQYGTMPFAGLNSDQKTERLREVAVTLLQEEITTKDSVFGKSFYERFMRPIAINGALRGVHAIFQKQIEKYGKKDPSPEDTARKNRVSKELELERGEHALAARSGDIDKMREFLARIETLEAEYLTLEKKAKEGKPIPKWLYWEKEGAPVIQWAAEAILLFADINAFIGNRPGGGDMLMGWPYALGRIVDHYASIRLFLPGGESFKDLPTYARKGAMYGLVAALILIAGQKLGLQNLLPNWNIAQPPSAGAPAQPGTGGGTGVTAPAPQPGISSKPPEEAPLTPDQNQKIQDDFRKSLGLP